MFGDEKGFEQEGQYNHHEKQQTKTLAQDLYIISYSKSWYELQSLLMKTKFNENFFIENLLPIGPISDHSIHLI